MSSIGTLSTHNMSTSTYHHHHQRPTLPNEITDLIIDHLHADVRALGTCSAICSDWLLRSRHHLFSTVQLWPWRVRSFFDLAAEDRCTFVRFVKSVEVDDSRIRPRTRARSKSRSKSRSKTRRSDADEDVMMTFSDAMAHTSFHSISRITSLRIHNVDWTVLSPIAQTFLRMRLATLVDLTRLELHGAIFHDLREVVRIVGVFPRLHHLTAGVVFRKYLEHTILGAEGLRMATPSGNLKSIELGTEDGLPVVLSCLTSPSSIAAAAGGQEHVVDIQTMDLKDIKPNHLQYIRKMLRKAGKNIHTLAFGFSPEIAMVMEGLSHSIDLSRLSNLHTLRIMGLGLPTAASKAAGGRHSILEDILPSILQRIESSFLDTIELRFLSHPIPECGHAASTETMNWRPLERVLLALHFFGMKKVRVVLEPSPEPSSAVDDGAQARVGPEYKLEVERTIRRGMADLETRGALEVCVWPEPEHESNPERRTRLGGGGVIEHEEFEDEEEEGEEGCQVISTKL